MALTALESELLFALKLLLAAWGRGEDPNGEAYAATKRAIEKAEKRRRDE